MAWLFTASPVRQFAWRWFADCSHFTVEAIRILCLTDASLLPTCLMNSLPKLDEWLRIRVSGDLIQKLKKLAKNDRRKLADFVRVTLENKANGTPPAVI